MRSRDGQIRYLRVTPDRGRLGPKGVTDVITPANSGDASKYRDPRADALRFRHHELYGGVELPVPVEAIAEDMPGETQRSSDASPRCR